MSEEKKDFVIKDRRIFSSEGETDDEKEVKKKPAPDETKKEVSTDERAEKTTPETAPEKEQDKEARLPEINFVTFVMSLNASALVNLGLVEDPASGTKVKQLLLAKQTIDILGMLQEKTRGNLTSDEENLLKNILYELRMIYVKEKG